jgi:hydroxymethylbilane synthase
MVLPLRENPSAPAQGALAIEIVRRRGDLRQLLAPLSCGETFAAVTHEREILRTYGGGCHQKIGVSVLHRSFGEITFLRGLTDNGQVLHDYSLRPMRPRPPKIAKDQMWPLNPFDADWFAREQIPVKPAEPNTALWIAKADALPDDWSPSPGQIVWISGVRSWRRLARRGVWVNGCAESLGEQEQPNVELLAGRNFTWLKLTHTGGYDEGAMPMLATYRLVPKTDQLDLSGKSYFFWQSGSSFERGLQLNPWIKSMTHFCGPGNTQRILEQNGVHPHVFLDHRQWLKETSL